MRIRGYVVTITAGQTVTRLPLHAIIGIGIECRAVRTLKVWLQFISTHQALHRGREPVRTLKVRLQFISTHQALHRGRAPVRLMTDSDRGSNAEQSESRHGRDRLQLFFTPPCRLVRQEVKFMKSREAVLNLFTCGARVQGSFFITQGSRYF